MVSQQRSHFGLRRDVTALMGTKVQVLRIRDSAELNNRRAALCERLGSRDQRVPNNLLSSAGKKEDRELSLSVRPANNFYSLGGFILMDPPRIQKRNAIPSSTGAKKKRLASQVSPSNFQEDISPYTPAARVQPNEKFNPRKFRSLEHQAQYAKVCKRAILAERKVSLKPNEYSEFQQELEKRNWKLLANPSDRINDFVVGEFCDNAMNKDKVGRIPRRSMVRGVLIPFDGEHINALLDGKAVATRLCIPKGSFVSNEKGDARKIIRQSMTTEAQIWLAFMQAKFAPNSHGSNIPMKRAYLIYAILQKMSIDIGSYISYEIVTI
ncbi:hypothetical protein VNO78_32988 [Psophocarpus tetragonolobus]|uniref:Putative plant transposon protein domain-containing protein n=1 Tax=Psophocarpus tetragonolobus TaxID=3891 RepID=A0AAN9RQE2_PSOTE